MNAVKLLTEDHQRVKELFSQFEEAGKRAYKKKHDIATKTIAELMVHTRLEEEIFYPAVAQKAGEEGQEMVLEGIEEHRVVDFMMDRLQSINAEDPVFSARFKVLKESVEHHLKEEERQLFPEAKKALADEMEELGTRMENRKKELQADLR